MNLRYHLLFFHHFVVVTTLFITTTIIGTVANDNITTVNYKYPTRSLKLSDDDKNVVLLEWKIKNTTANEKSKITVEFSLTFHNINSNENEYYFALGVANSRAVNKMIGPPESYAVIGTFPNSNNQNNKNAIYIMEYELKTAASDSSGIKALYSNKDSSATVTQNSGIGSCIKLYCPQVHALCDTNMACKQALTCAGKSALYFADSTCSPSQSLPLARTEVQRIAIYDGLKSYYSCASCFEEHCYSPSADDEPTAGGLIGNLYSASISKRNDSSVNLKFETSKIGKYDLNLTSGNFTTFIWAYGKVVTNDNNDEEVYKMSYHGSNNRGILKIDLINGESINAKVDIRKQIHAGLMIFAFGIFIPGGVMVAVFFKDMEPKNQNIKIHKSAQSLGIMFGLCGVVVAFLFVPNGHHLTKPHHILGIVTICLAILQPVNAFFRPFKEEGHGVWLFIHRFFGTVTLLCGIVNIYIGISVFPSSKGSNEKSLETNTVYLIIMLIFSCAMLIFLMLYCFCKNCGNKAYKEKLHELWNETGSIGINKNKKSAIESVSPLLSEAAKMHVEMKSRPFEHIVLGSKIPSNSVTLTFENVSFTTYPTRSNPNGITIVQNLTGAFIPGTMTALMGPSGAGKSTMLDVLALRERGGLSTGKICANGKPVDKNTIRKLSGYVLQTDCLIEELTVKETLMFAANMQMPGNTSAKEREERVKSVIEELGLTHVTNSVVGGSRIRGVSGGERRRVSIGVQLVSSPQLLFLDEPTSGLDAHTAFEVCFILRRLADKGKTIICTIHQPSAKLFEAFDSLILLSIGKQVYVGDRTNCAKYFEKYGYRCKAGWNPADYYLTLIDVARTSAGIGHDNDDTKDKQDDQKETHDISSGNDDLLFQKKLKERQNRDDVIPLTKLEIEKIINNFKNTNEGKATLKTISDCHASFKKKNDVEDSIGNQEDIQLYARSNGPQLYYLIIRNIKEKWRDPVGFKVQCSQNVMFGLVTGSLYSDLGEDQRAYSVSMVILLILINNAMATAAQSVATNFRQKEIFNHETKDGMYSPQSYFYAKIAVGLPIMSILGAILVFITYYWIGLNDGDGRLTYFFLLNILFIALFDAVSDYIAITLDTLDAAYGVSNSVQGFWLTFGGIFIPFNSIPDYWKFAYWLSPFTYAYAGAVVNEYEGSKDEAWIEQMSIQVENKWTNIAVIAGFFIFFRYIAMVALNRNEVSKIDWKDITRRDFGGREYTKGDFYRFCKSTSMEFLFPDHMEKSRSKITKNMCCQKWNSNEKRKLAFVLLYIAAYLFSFVTQPAAQAIFTSACKKSAMDNFCDENPGCSDKLNSTYAVDYENAGFCVGTVTPYKQKKNCEDNGGIWSAEVKPEALFVPTFQMKWNQVDDLSYYCSNAIYIFFLVTIGSCIDLQENRLKWFLSIGAGVEFICCAMIYSYDVKTGDLVYLFINYIILSIAQKLMFVFVTMLLALNTMNDDLLLKLVSNPSVQLKHVEEEKDTTVQSQMSRGIVAGNILVFMSLFLSQIISNSLKDSIISAEFIVLITSASIILFANCLGIFYMSHNLVSQNGNNDNNLQIPIDNNIEAASCTSQACFGCIRFKDTCKLLLCSSKLKQFQYYTFVYALFGTGRKFYSQMAVYLFSVEWRMDVNSMFFAIFVISLASTFGALLIFFISRINKLTKFTRIVISVILTMFSAILVHFVPHNKVFVFLLCIIFGLGNGIFDIESNVLLIHLLPSFHIGSLISISMVIQTMMQLFLPPIVNFCYNTYNNYSTATLFILPMYLLGLVIFQCYDSIMGVVEKIQNDADEEKDEDYKMMSSASKTFKQKRNKDTRIGKGARMTYTGIVLARTTHKNKESDGTVKYKNIAQQLNTVTENDAAVDDDVPVGWSRAYDRTGKAYLWNIETRETKWMKVETKWVKETK